MNKELKNEIIDDLQEALGILHDCIDAAWNRGEKEAQRYAEMSARHIHDVLIKLERIQDDNCL